VFDFRYHIASLAAVFLALVLGILIGVAISGRGFVDKAERKQLNSRIADLRRSRDAEKARADELQSRQKVSEDFISQTYPVLMKDRLRGKKIVVLVLGASGGATGAAVDDTLADAGGTQLRYRALKVPIDAGGIRKALASHAALRAYAGERQLDDLGRELASELVSGGKTPVWDALAKTLVEQQRGGLDSHSDGLVLIRAVKPQTGPSARFLSGLYAGLATSGVPSVGVEAVDADPSAVAAWRIAHLSTVDDVDTLPGRLALAALLAGSDRGQYGIKEGATPLPTIPAVG
jgi:Copper transport outer membrane protein, MctB